MPRLEGAVEGQNGPKIIDLEEASTSVTSPQVVTTQILFGTISTIVTTTAENLNKTDTSSKEQNMVNDQEQIG